MTRDQLIRMRDWLNINGRARTRLTVAGMTAEGGRVAVQTAGHIELESGDVYATGTTCCSKWQIAISVTCESAPTLVWWWHCSAMGAAGPTSPTGV